MNLWCEVNKEKLFLNIKKIREIDNKKLMAVVKGNAYGMGMNKIVQLLENKVDYFAVATMEEAKEIKTKKDVLILSPLCLPDINLEGNFIYTVDDENTLELFPKNKNYRIHIYVDTGMNRPGINEIDNIINRISSNYPNITVDGIYTHLHNSSNKKYTLSQIKRFKDKIEKYIGTIPNIHCLNSEGFINKKIREAASFTNLIRIGNLIYGYEGLKLGFQKIYKVKAKVIRHYIVEENGYIGYGNKFKVKKNTDVGLIQCGTINKLGYKKEIKQCFAKEFIKLILNKFKKSNVISYNKESLKLLCSPNMNCSMIDITNIEEKENITVDINISTILLDSSVERIYN